MFFSDGLKKLKRLFGAESSDGLQEQLASLRLAIEQGEETIRSLRAELQAAKEELRAARQELAAEKAARQAAEVALADERGAVVALKEAVRKLSLDLHHAQARLATDSTNSSKPPSSDFPKKPGKSGDAKPDPKSLRKRSGRRPGAQKGHKGAGFPLPEGPPDKIVCCLPSQCCGCALADLCADRERVADTRYVVDYEVKVVKAVYMAVARKCPLRGGGVLAGEFPAEARGTKQYGRNLRLLPVALFNNFTCSFDKISRFASELTGLKLSVGWCWEQYDRAGHRAETAEFKEEVKERLHAEKVVSADETGARCGGRNAWLHTVSTPELTLQHASMKRGVEGMKEGGFLDSYGHILVHDCLGSYWTVNKPENRARAEAGVPAPDPAGENCTPPASAEAGVPAPASAGEDCTPPASGEAGAGAAPYTHALCNQHVCRELRWAYEHGHGQKEGRQDWALELLCFLRSLNSMRKKSMERGGRSFRRKTVDTFRERFDELVEEGLAANQATDELKGSATLRKIRALLGRLEKRKDDFLRFLEDFDVPFTSNEAERDLRSHKGRLAISGCFRTFRGLASHANLSTVFKTLMKAGKSWREAADVAVNGRPVELLPPRRDPEANS